MLQQSLTDLGYSVNLAQDGLQALKLFDQKRPALVISDVQMPGMGGYELCRAVKEKDPSIPVMLLTAYRDVEDIIRGLEAGADNYLTKPCAEAYLAQRVRSLLDTTLVISTGPDQFMEVPLGGKTYRIRAGNQQIMGLLLSTFENTVEQNRLLRVANEQLSEARAALASRNQELLQINKQKDHLLGMAAHDLRNPLGVVMGYSRFLLQTEMGASLNEEQRRFVASIERSSSLMLTLVNDLLDVTALESGAVRLNLTSTDVVNVITECLSTLNLLADKKEISLQFEVKDPLPRTELDSPKLEQVLTNLVSNAIKYSHPGTEVKVRLSNQGKGLLLEVEDQGQGIPTQEQQKLFLPFSRTSVKTTGGESSTGLGLAIVKKIVESHGGRIWVESRVGKGSTFSVYIPWERTSTP